MNHSGVTYAADVRSEQTQQFWRSATGDEVDPEATVRATAEAAGVPVGVEQPWTLRMQLVLGSLLLLLMLGLVVLMLTLQQPRRLTHWGTFWMLGAPGGLGIT